MRPTRTSSSSSLRRGGPLSLCAILACASLSTACASSVGPGFEPADAPADAAVKDAVVDTGPSIDAPAMPDVAIDRALDLPRVDVMDAPRPFDAPCTADTMNDRLNCGACGHACASTEICQFSLCTRRPGDCPPSCRATAECGGCAVPGEPGIYCCISGLCLFMPGATCPVLEDRPPMNDPDPDPIDVMVPPSDISSEAAAGDAPPAD